MKAELCKRILIILCALSSYQEGRATKHTITASDFAFAPNMLTIQLGDTIQWTFVNGVHTTTSTTIPSGATPWNAPLDATNMSFTYVPTVAGAYTYVCTPHASMGMTGTFSVQTSTSVKETSLERLAIFPNPARSEITLSNYTDEIELSLIDAAGRAVQLPQSGVAHDNKTYSVSHLTSGLYMLYIKSGELITVRKVLIEK